MTANPASTDAASNRDCSARILLQRKQHLPMACTSLLLPRKHKFALADQALHVKADREKLSTEKLNNLFNKATHNVLGSAKHKMVNLTLDSTRSVVRHSQS